MKKMEVGGRRGWAGGSYLCVEVTRGFERKEEVCRGHRLPPEYFVW